MASWLCQKFYTERVSCCFINPYRDCSNRYNDEHENKEENKTEEVNNNDKGKEENPNFDLYSEKIELIIRDTLEGS